MAVARGAAIFEKHFTLDQNLPGPDHWFSETPESLEKWVIDVREAYKMLGNPKLEPTKIEMKNRVEYHRSITTACTIEKGEILTENNLCMRRPGDGLPASRWDEVIGKKARRHLKKNIQLKEDDFE